MKHRKIWIGSGLVLLIAAMLTVYVIRNTQAQAEVKTVKAAREEIREEIVTSGVLEAGRQQEVYLDPERGELAEIPVKPGKKVKKGTVLVRYRNDLLDSEKQQAEMQIEAARVKRSGLLRQLEEAKKAGQSVPGVPGGGAVSEEQIRQEIRLAELEMKQAQKQLETLRKRLDRLTVRSNLSGTVVQVNPNGGRGASAEPLVIVADLEDLKVRADVSELDVMKVKKGQSVIIRSDALPDEEWKGEVIRVGELPRSDEKMAAAPGGGSGQVVYPVEVRLKTPIPLKLGSNLIVEIAAEKRKALTLPQEAVREEQGKSFVFAVEKGKAVRREVKVGISSGDRLEILSGVKPGETVVLDPPEDLRSGTEVKAR
ncbi:HlyD family secretion protein [Planifilum fulgidum]|uniref:HlyD family secretion protein n=1 Tax=Planifilum fulgidum TaxID=201973 RepID=A0A1I2LZ49_9BACL|nr:efflux RND transporter periplasmic adaptor subunit [Planifilum fulgidum]SFF84464.1 HlyD family secretion protein [Planifilum fulgidum]